MNAARSAACGQQIPAQVTSAAVALHIRGGLILDAKVAAEPSSASVPPPGCGTRPPATRPKARTPSGTTASRSSCSNVPSSSNCALSYRMARQHHNTLEPAGRRVRAFIAGCLGLGVVHGGGHRHEPIRA